MKKIFFLIFSLIVQIGHSQNYFFESDGSQIQRAGGSEITQIKNSAKPGFLLNPSINLIQTDIKLTAEKSWVVPKSETVDDKLGFGVFVKAKSDDGIAPLLSKGKFSPGISTGLFFNLTQVGAVGTPPHGIYRSLTFSAGYDYYGYDFFSPDSAFSNSIVKKDFHGFNVGVSYVAKPALKSSSDNLMLGFSVNVSKKNNYKNLDQVALNDFKLLYDSASNTIRQVVKSEKDGKSYAVGQLKSYTLLNLKMHVGWNPAFTDHMATMVFYPSIAYRSGAKVPVVSTGLGLYLNKKGSPSLSYGGIFFELNDMANAAGSTESSFFKRAFTFGLVTSLNVPFLK